MRVAGVSGARTDSSPENSFRHSLVFRSDDPPGFEIQEIRRLIDDRSIEEHLRVMRLASSLITKFASFESDF